jgi:hypothetical protein
MKKFCLCTAVALMMALPWTAALAQNVIYRCGNEYLNDAILAQSRGCQVVEGGNVTLVPGTRVNPALKAEPSPAAGGSAVASVPTRSQRRPSAVDTATQRGRDSDARSILLAELKTAEGRLSEQQQAYQNAEVDKRGMSASGQLSDKVRPSDRANELKDAIHRYTADIAGLKREIARLPTAVSSSGQ